MPTLAAVLALALAAGDPPASGEGAEPCAPVDVSIAGVGSLEEELAQAAALVGAAPLQPGLLRRPSGARPLWLCDGDAPREVSAAEAPRTLALAVVPPSSLTKFHSARADDRNDGALWAGRGVSSDISTGVRARWRWLTLQLAPLAAWQENRAFRAPPVEAAGLSPYANPYNGSAIDLPLRMGSGPFWTVDPGQSYVRADLWNLAIGLSNENLWWGPGIRNSILMTNSGPGFPHVFLGTARPVDVGIGRLELELLWGQLRESGYFDSDGSDDRRLFEALALTLTPSFAPGLTLGYARVFLFPRAGSVAARHYFDPLWRPFLTGLPRRSGASPDDQLLSLFFRWASPAVQLEVYGEWARDDGAAGLRDFLMEPGRSQAYNLGLQKLFRAGPRWVRFQVELTRTLDVPPAMPTSNVPPFFTGSAERQGYTNRGQMLGAGLGPQGDAQFVAVDWFLAAGRLGPFVERILRNERYFHESGRSSNSILGHDLEMSYGLRGSHAVREWDVTWELALARHNRPNFERASRGIDATLSLRWWPGRREPPALPAPAATRVSTSAGEPRGASR